MHGDRLPRVSGNCSFKMLFQDFRASAARIENLVDSRIIITHGYDDEVRF